MDAVATALLLLALAVLLYFVLRPSPLASVAGPPLSDYLPGGLTFKLLSDPTATVRVLVELARKHGDVYQVWLGPRRTLIVSNPADLVQVISTRSSFERPHGMVNMFETTIPGSLFTMPPDEHFPARRKLRESFGHQMLRDFHFPIIEAITEISGILEKHTRSAESGAAGPIVDINRILFLQTIRVILNVAFGAELPASERERFVNEVDSYVADLLKEVIEYPVRQLLTPLGIRNNMFRHKEYVDSTILKIVQKRLNESSDKKDQRSPDLLDAFVSLDNHDTARLVSETILFAVAGFHNTSLTTSFAMFNIVQHPHIVKKIQEEVDAATSSRSGDDPLTPDDMPKLTYTYKVHKEALRYSSSAAFVMRRAQNDVTLKGSKTFVPKGTQLLTLFQATHRDNTYWDDADEFIPERWGTKDAPGEGDKVPAGAFIPFGIGQRNCAGQFLAEYQMILTLAELFRRFDFTLGCEPHEVVKTSGFAEVGRYSSKKDGNLDMGIPLRVSSRD